MAASTCCRVCLGKAEHPHYCSLFSRKSMERDLAGRLSQLSGISVSQENGYPTRMCRSCSDKFISLEKSLSEFRGKALASYKVYSRKRSYIPSPSSLCAMSRPPAKRSRARCLFPDSPMATTTTVPLVDISNNPDSGAETHPVEAHPSLRVDIQDHPTLNIPHKSVQVVVNSPSRSVPYSATLSNNLEKIGRVLVGEHLPSIAKAVFANAELRNDILTKFLDLLDGECSELCRKTQDTISPFRHFPIEKLTEFSWDELADSMKTKAPTIYKIFSRIVSHSDHRNESKKGAQHTPSICMAIALLLKERNREMCGVQSAISIALFASQVQKKVFTRLNHLNITISYTAVQKLALAISKLNEVPIKVWIQAKEALKFFGDNVDMSIGVRDLRSDHLKHLYHMYSVLAVKSRVPPPDGGHAVPRSFNRLSPASFFPSESDVSSVRLNLAILVSRILCNYIKGLKKFRRMIPEHIPHRYSLAMAKKSEVVVIDVLYKNEACHQDMLDIMKYQQSFLGKNFSGSVPSGGDLLTCERQRCAKQHKMDSDTPEERFDYLEPVVEDWHMLMCLLQVIWKKHFTDSSSDHGTLGQLFALLKRLPAAKNPKKEMNACTDALFTVLKGHFLAFACKELGLETLDSDLDHPLLSSTSVSNLEKQKFIVCLSMKVVENCTLIGDTLVGKKVKESGDMKYNYTRSLCHYASLALELYDAWHEADGNRVTRCWRILLPHFFESGRTKYTLEAMRLQIQLASLPSSLVHQITWDRFINTHGGLGRNLPCDLHNEHVNKPIKEAIRHMGANFSQNALTTVARSITYMSAVSARFDEQCKVTPDSSAHTTRGDDDDVKLVMGVIKRERLWEVHRGRMHRKFKNVTSDPLEKLNRNRLQEWMTKKITDYRRYQQLQEGPLSDTEPTDPDSSDSD